MFNSLLTKQHSLSKFCLLLMPQVIMSASFAVNASEVVVNTKNILTFSQAIKLAQINDPWLTGNQHKQDSLLALSQAADTLPDPKVSLAIANLPTNGFDFSQEAMTQFKVGITQMFPRGDTLTIKNQQLKLQSQAYPFEP